MLKISYSVPLRVLLGLTLSLADTPLFAGPRQEMNQFVETMVDNIHNVGKHEKTHPGTIIEALVELLDKMHASEPHNTQLTHVRDGLRGLLGSGCRNIAAFQKYLEALNSFLDDRTKQKIKSMSYATQALLKCRLMKLSSSYTPASRSQICNALMQ